MLMHPLWVSTSLSCAESQIIFQTFIYFRIQIYWCAIGKLFNLTVNSFVWLWHVCVIKDFYNEALCVCVQIEHHFFSSENGNNIALLWATILKWCINTLSGKCIDIAILLRYTMYKYQKISMVCKEDNQ